MMKKITNHFTTKRFITAFISLIICACIKFILFPIIIPCLPEVPDEFYQYFMLGVLYIPIKFLVLGVVDCVLSIFFPETLTMDSGSNHPSYPTGPSQHSQYPPQTGAGRSPQSFLPAHSQDPRPGFSSAQPVYQAGPSSTSQPIQSASTSQSTLLNLSTDLRSILEKTRMITNNM